MTVVTKEGDSDCGYPVAVEYPDDIRKGPEGVRNNFYYFYLNYDRDTEKKHIITGYSTNICSGNYLMMHEFWNASARLREQRRLSSDATNQQDRSARP